MVKKILTYIGLFILIYSAILILAIFNIININNINNISNMIFTSIGIIFSVGFTIILSFNIENINNKDGFDFIKDNLSRISLFSLTLFILSLIVFIISNVLNTNNNIITIKYINSIFLSLLSIFLVSLSINYKKLFDIKLEVMERIFERKKEIEYEIKISKMLEESKNNKNNKK